MAGPIANVIRADLRRRGRGFALVLVIGLVAAVAVLGMVYIEDNALTVQSSANLTAVSRARAAAESGIEHAVYWLGFRDPPGANADGYWPGATGQRVGDSLDYYDVSVARDPDNASRYRVTSTGHCVRGDSTLSRRIVAWVNVSVDPIVEIHHGLHMDYPEWGGFSTVNRNVTVIGNVHVNGSLLSIANIQGDLVASGFAMYTVPPSGQVRAWQPTEAFAPLQPSHYDSYRMGDTVHQAVVFDDVLLDQNFDKAGPGPKNPLWHMTSANPGGVLRCTGVQSGRTKLIVKSHVDFTGTVVVDGDVVIQGSNVQMTAQPGFPAIVASGNLVISGRNQQAVINGAVIVGGTVINEDNIRGSSVAINGPVHTGNGWELPNTSQTSLAINFASSNERGWLYDFTISPDDWPAGRVDVESWTDR